MREHYTIRRSASPLGGWEVIGPPGMGVMLRLLHQDEAKAVARLLSAYHSRAESLVELTRSGRFRTATMPTARELEGGAS